MIFLPIAGRELRVASRKRSTFWVRIAAALVAVLIGSGFLVLAAVWSFGFGAGTLGKGLFALLTWLNLAVALSAGLFFTSDCLSEEKREGTLGFLFLTDLRGYDVVLGKLLATSLRGFYALLAVVPILAVTLLMGGVTSAQFWKTSLALVNALVLSLAAGLFVSAISRDSQKAMAVTLLLLVLLAAGGPAGDALSALIGENSFTPVLSLSSPVYLFVTAGGWGRTLFWSSLLANQVVAWVLLGLACVVLPRTWQEKAKASVQMGTRAYWWKYGSAKRRLSLRRKLADVNPVLWLACRERWQAVLLWFATVVLVGGFVAIFATDEQWMLWFAWSYLAGALVLVLYLGIASQAARFFVEARRNGLIELVLATPLPASRIVQGQWRALLRMFGLPLALCLAVQLFGAALVQQRTWNQFAGATAPPPPVTAPPVPATNNTTSNVTIVMTNSVTVSANAATGTTTVSIPGFAAPNVLMTLATSFAGTLTVAANLVALAWFGMWMGLNSKSTNLATLKTILFVQVIPWFALTFLSMLAVPLLILPSLIRGGAAGPTQMMLWFPLITSAVMAALTLAKDVGFSLWARRKLYLEFRDRVAQVVAPIRPVLPPPLPQSSAPPVIR
ncbi:MAG TPA: hypothetical protein VJW76_05735 [Verrucomicrobiae bacterium]|nr:hypothetical protein [Verrucomicrobiae bacterium]